MEPQKENSFRWRKVPDDSAKRWRGLEAKWCDCARRAVAFCLQLNIYIETVSIPDTIGYNQIEPVHIDWLDMHRRFNIYIFFFLRYKYM